MNNIQRIEWLTLALMMATYALWLVLTAFNASVPLYLFIPAMAVLLSFHNSVQHEIIHYHPTPSQRFNEALGHPPLILYLPFLRYRDLHREHHTLDNISYPARDPESYYLSPAQWANLSSGHQKCYQLNNTLLGRLILGPLLAIAGFLMAEYQAIRAGNQAVQRAWLMHVPLLVLVVTWLVYWQVPLWAYVVACYGAMSLTAIRTFAEHQAVAEPEQRTIIVEARSFLSLLFLDNSLHAVHHKYPALPWYQLRPVYNKEREAILTANGGYYFKNYFEIFRRYLLKAKEPIAHPLAKQ